MKVLLATSNEFAARVAAELCGRADRLKAHYTLSGTRAGAHISLLCGRATASKQTLRASKTYMLESDYVSPARVTELQHAPGDCRTVRRAQSIPAAALAREAVLAGRGKAVLELHTATLSFVHVPRRRLTTQTADVDTSNLRIYV